MEIGSWGKAKFEVKFGTRFPEVGDERVVANNMGSFVIRFVSVGTPEWTPKHTVLVPVTFTLQEVVEVTTKGKLKFSGLKLV